MKRPLITDATKNVIDLASELLVPAAITFRTIKLQPQLDRYENDAEHSFLLATLGCALAHELDPSLDLGKVAHYALVHDLVEVHAGDTTIWSTDEKLRSKAERESEALKIIKKRFGRGLPWIAEQIEGYEHLRDDESCFVYALDKIIPYIVMIAVDHQPFPPNKKVYREKMAIARKKIEKFPKLLKIFDDLDAVYQTKPHFIDETTPTGSSYHEG